MEGLKQQFARIIRDRLEEEGLTQSDLATCLGVTASSVSQVLNGNPTLATVQKWFDLLDIDISFKPTGFHSHHRF
jgi:transcriptional regulator with XRE-family HTH domain